MAHNINKKYNRQSECHIDEQFVVFTGKSSIPFETLSHNDFSIFWDFFKETITEILSLLPGKRKDICLKNQIKFTCGGTRIYFWIRVEHSESDRFMQYIFDGVQNEFKFSMKTDMQPTNWDNTCGFIAYQIPKYFIETTQEVNKNEASSVQINCIERFCTKLSLLLSLMYQSFVHDKNTSVSNLQQLASL